MNPKKKILFVITKSNWGGAQRYVFDLATSLDKNQFDVEVVAGGNGLLKEKLEEAGIPVISLHTLERDVNLKKEYASAKELYKIIREKKPDIVHLNSSKAGGLGAFVARLCRTKKIIFTAHAWAFNENREFASKMLISILHWITVMLAHKTIAVSESVREQVVHMPFMKKRIEVIHLGVNSFEYKGREEARRILEQTSLSKIPFVQAPIVVGTVAELHPVKGLLYAIDAIALLIEEYPSLHYVIIGEGDLRPVIEKQITKRRLESHVHLAGFIDEAKTYMKAFDIFTLPSLSEAFGYCLAEAGLVEIPVIASHVGGIVEVVDEAGILVPSKNARLLADGMKKLIDSPELRHKLAQELHERILTQFNVEQMREKTFALYVKN
jgi:glycosyltransferase involved in cell wall biosynthesis